MTLDARGLGSRELFVKLKELLSSQCGRDVFIEVMVASYQDARQGRAFVSMSGCRADIQEKEGYYVLLISGNVCCI